MRVLFGLLGLLAAAAAMVAAGHAPGAATPGATPSFASAGAGSGHAPARPHATATRGYALTGIAPHRTRAGLPYLVAGVRNTGHEPVEAGGSAQLTGGPGGVSAGPVLATVLTLTPGRSGTLVFPFATGLTPGPWRLTLTLTGGPVTRTVRTTVTFATKASKPHGDNPAPAMIWAASIIFVLVVITLIAAPRPPRRRRPSATTRANSGDSPHQRTGRAPARRYLIPRDAPRTGAGTGPRTSPARADPARDPR